MNKQFFRFTLFLLMCLSVLSTAQHKWKSQLYPVQIIPLWATKSRSPLILLRV